MDEAVEDVLLQSLMVILDILPSSNFEGVVTVRENDRGQLVLVVLGDDRQWRWVMGTLCLHQNLRTLQDNKECVQNCKYNDILSSSLVSHNYVNYLGSFSPTRALQSLNEVVVGQSEEIYQGCGAHTSLRGGGNKVTPS